MIKIYWKKLDDEADIPVKHYPTDAGYDLYSTVDIDIPVGKHVFVNTNIAAQMEITGSLKDSFVPSAKIEGCSGNAKKLGVSILGGRWDNSYTGNIGVIMANLGDDIIHIKKHDKIAQFVPQAMPVIDCEEIVKGDFKETDRGTKGFGSTGGIA